MLFKLATAANCASICMLPIFLFPLLFFLPALYDDAHKHLLKFLDTSDLTDDDDEDGVVKKRRRKYANL